MLCPKIHYCNIGYEAANLGSLVLRPFAPSGAPSVLPRAPSVLPRCSPLLPLPSRNGKGSRAALEGAAREHRGSKEGSMGRCRARSRWEPELTALSRLQLPSISSVLTMKMRMSSFQGNDSVAFVMTRASLDVALFSYISIASSSQRDKTVSLHHMIYIRDRRWSLLSLIAS